MRCIQITKKKLSCNKLPQGFSECRILQVSDLHSKCFGKNQADLIKTTWRTKPDYIFITGDLIDEHHQSIEDVKKYLKAAVSVAPIFYVTGNHEWKAEKQRIQLFEFMKRLGITILQDDIIELERNGEWMQLMGMDDPYRLQGKVNRTYDRRTTKDFLNRFVKVNRRRKDMFTILLSHRPELICFYSKAGIDLVFAGHAHGGMVRIPGLGGVLAPHQGFFPKYTEGTIREKKTTMVVSRGLGDGVVPFRINNRPEVVLTVLR